MGDLKVRTKAMAVCVFRFAQELPRDYATVVIGKQLVRSATSVAANYRSARRARSKKDFINKLGIVEEEADETLFWLEMLEELHLGKDTILKALLKEVNELVAIFVSSRITAKGNQVART
jgi:four helix bundle protein